MVCVWYHLQLGPLSSSSADLGIRSLDFAVVVWIQGCLLQLFAAITIVVGCYLRKYIRVLHFVSSALMDVDDAWSSHTLLCEMDSTWLAALMSSA